MASRHATALTLLGWYLLAPPLDQAKRPDVDAPLPKWNHLGSYDRASGCENEIRQVQKQAKHRDETTRNSVVFLRCIESTDPRLAK